MIIFPAMDLWQGSVVKLEAKRHTSVETEPAAIVKAKVLALPGVGAFGKVARQVAPYRDELKGRLEEGLPALAVCIGMQVLYESSEEGPGKGFGLFPGRVRRLRHARLPHIGWNSVTHRGQGPFAGVAPSAYFYFVHSYAPSECAEPCIATTDYGGNFAAGSVAMNVWGVQFHPEKSSDAGYQLIQNFVAFARERA